MEKIIQFSEAYDKRAPEPDKNYGIGAVTIRFVLKGDKGAVQFYLLTSWHLPHVQEELKNKPPHLSLSIEPMPADLGYHSPVPRYEGQMVTRESCEYLDGKPCYYDVSGLRAEGVFKVLLEKGSDGVWEFLEKEYRSLFEDNDKEGGA